MTRPVVTIVCDAVHLTTTTRSGIYNIHRLRRAVTLIRDLEPAESITRKLRAEFPTMASADVTNHILAARQVIAHDLKI